MWCLSGKKKYFLKKSIVACAVLVRRNGCSLRRTANTKRNPRWRENGSEERRSQNPEFRIWKNEEQTCKAFRCSSSFSFWILTPDFCLPVYYCTPAIISPITSFNGSFSRNPTRLERMTSTP